MISTTAMVSPVAVAALARPAVSSASYAPAMLNPCRATPTKALRASGANGLSLKQRLSATPLYMHRRNVTVCSIPVSGPIDAPLIQSMRQKIQEALEPKELVVKDVSGDQRHVSIYVVSDAFEGETAVNRQRKVYKAIWEELQQAVHAVDNLVTRTPEEAASKPPPNFDAPQ